MAKLGISTGSQPNDGTGDSLIDGAVKANSNFDEIYTTIGDGTTLAVPVTSVSAGTGINVSGSTGNVTITNIGIADTNNLRTDFLEVSGISTLSGGIEIPSNVPLKVGDITIEERTSPSTGSLIETPGDFLIKSGRLLINNAANSENMIVATQNGGVELYYNNAERLRTVADGVTLTGSIACSNIDSTNLETGTGFLTLGNSSSQFDIKFSPSTGNSPAIRYDVSSGISIYNRYNSGADLLADVTFGTSQTFLKHITPFADSTYHIGTNTNRFLTVYSDEFHGGGANITGISTLNIVNYSGGGGGGAENDTLADVTSRGATTNQTITFSTSKGISMDTASNNPFQIYGTSNSKAYIAHAQNNGGGGAGDLVVIAKNGLHVYGGSSENTVNLGLEVTSGSSNLLYQGSSKLTTTNTGINVTGEVSNFTNPSSNTPSSLQIETNDAGLGNTIRSSSSLNLRTNGSAFSVTLDNTSAILAGGTGASQYVSLYGSGAEKLKTTSTGINVTGSVQVGLALNMNYQNNASTILHNNLNGQFNIESVSGIHLKPGPSHVSIYSSDDVLRFKVKSDATDLYSDINVGVSTNSVGFTSTNSVNTPTLTLSHNNPTIAGTSGTTGNIKSIGGAPFYYDGTNWREFVLATGTPVSQPEDTDWDQVIIRNDFDTSLTEQRFGQTVFSGSSSNVDLVSSPVKVGTKSARLGFGGYGNTYAVAYPKRNEYNFTGAWTIEGWFYLDTLPSGTGLNVAPLFAHTYVADKTWGLTVEKSSGYLYFRWINNSSTTHSYANTAGRGTPLSVAHNLSLLSNAWAHIALVRKASNGSIHLFVNGTESSTTSSDQVIDNDIPVFATSYEFWFGKIRPTGTSDIFMDGNVDDIRVSTSERYTSNFNPPTTALPISGTGSTSYTPPGSLLGEISLGGSPTWTGTTGVTASQVAAGQYRATFATAYSSATDYVIQTSMNDYTPATTPVGIGVSRFTTHADFFVRRVSDGANIDTGSLAIDLFKK